MARKDARDDIPISAWEAVLKEERSLTRWRGNHSPSGAWRLENGHIENCRTDEEDVIARKFKFLVREMVTNELSTMLEESLDDILKTSFHNAQDTLQSIVNSVIEQMILKLQLKDLLGKMLDSHVAKFFYADADTKGCIRGH